MSSISNLPGLNSSRLDPYAASRSSDPRRPGDAGPNPSPADRTDRVTLSEAALATREGTSVRTDLVDRVRAEINAGTYETPERLDLAVEGLLRDVTA